MDRLARPFAVPSAVTMANDLEVQEKPVAHATAAAAAGSGVKAHRVSTGDSIGQPYIPKSITPEEIKAQAEKLYEFVAEKK